MMYRLDHQYESLNGKNLVEPSQVGPFNIEQSYIDVEFLF